MQRSSFGAGSLAAAASALSDETSSEALAPGDPAAFLARRMDLRGSVDLARQLAVIDRGAAAATTSPEAAIRLRALVRSRLGELKLGVDRVFSEPFQRRNKLPAPAQFHATLAETGALATRIVRPVAAAVDTLWAPFGELYTLWLDRVGYEARVLRDEITPAIHALGPVAARLERLDAALLGATAKGRAELLNKLIPGLARSFARTLSNAIASLPVAATPAHVEAWAVAPGWLRPEIARGHAVVAAVLAHERGRLEGLVGPLR
ncbi:MAG: hypothetical protein ABJE95_08105 [Byssovorax sp.]